MYFFFAFTLFLSSALLFALQPMFAKMVLPMLGGSPSAWNASMLFYQVLLLAGYGYAFASSKLLGRHWQGILHLTLCLLAVLVLPLSISESWPEPPVSSSPVPWLLGLLALSTGIPFFVLSTTAPLLQRWFGTTRYRNSQNPYALYSASNLGSLLGLLGYPLLVEPYFSLPQQSRAWSLGYGILVLICAFCFLKSLAHHSAKSQSATPRTEAIKPLSWSTRIFWVLCALIPSSHTLSVTQYLSTEIATIPLLWAIPLSLYLLTYVIAFSRKPLLTEHFYLRSFLIALPPLIAVLASRVTEPIGILMGLHLIVFFLSCGLFHSKLAQSRPHFGHLTEFYLWISIGGALGGVFNTLVAPQIFSSVTEYPLILFLAAIFTRSSRDSWFGDKAQKRDYLLPALLGAAIGIAVFLFRKFEIPFGSVTFTLMFGLPAVLSFALSGRALRFAFSIAAVLIASSFLHAESELLFIGRSFFGVHRVLVSKDGKFRELYHGSTLHGVQALDSKNGCDPLTYYYQGGPLGQIFEKLQLKAQQSIGIIGLGAGSIACYGLPRQAIDFYEIDPIVDELARDKSYFGFLGNTSAQVKVNLGDARLSLARLSERRYELLILDAYSSGSIPIHLLTREAVSLYISRMTDTGVLAFHISNRHIDLSPVVQAIANELALVFKEQVHQVSDKIQEVERKSSSRWILLAKNQVHLKGLALDPRWSSGNLNVTKTRVWTDDYSSLLKSINWSE